MHNRRSILGSIAALPLAACMHARAEAAPVNWSGFVPIGGVEQWLSLRGASSDAPVLLFLHGGPGEAMSPFIDMFAPWERGFTIGVWDQRGSGRTFGRNRGAQGEVSLDRLSADVVEIAGYLRGRFNQRKIVLVGQSWGSVLAWSVIHQRPDLFSAYVGTGQAVSWSHALVAREAYARAQATAANDTEALAALDAAARLPLTDLARANASRRWIMGADDLAFIETQRRYVGNPPPQTGDVADWIEGYGFAAEALTPAVLAFDAYASGPRADIPVIVVQGRDDRITPTSVAEQFVADLTAPAKHFAVIDGGHFACYTNAEAFAAVLAERVLQLA